MIAFPVIKVSDHLQKASGFDPKTYIVTKVSPSEIEAEVQGIRSKGQETKVVKILLADSFLWRKIRKETGGG